MGIFQKYRLLLAVVLVLVAQAVSPPQLTVALACSWVWVGFELIVFFSSKKLKAGNA
jgi:hypothetical protein